MSILGNNKLTFIIDGSHILLTIEELIALSAWIIGYKYNPNEISKTLSMKDYVFENKDGDITVISNDHIYPAVNVKIKYLDLSDKVKNKINVIM